MHSSHIAFGSGCGSSSDFPCFGELINFERYWSGTWWAVLHWHVSGILSWTHLGYEFPRGRPQRSVSFSSHDIRGMYGGHDLWLCVLTSSPWLRESWSSFSSPEMLVLPLPVPFWKEVSVSISPLKDENLCCSSRRQSSHINYLQSFCTKDSSISPVYLFIQSFVYISMDSWIFIFYFSL